MKCMNTFLALAVIGGSTAGLFGMEEKKQENLKKSYWQSCYYDDTVSNYEAQTKALNEFKEKNKEDQEFCKKCDFKMEKIKIAMQSIIDDKQKASIFNYNNWSKLYALPYRLLIAFVPVISAGFADKNGSLFPWLAAGLGVGMALNIIHELLAAPINYVDAKICKNIRNEFVITDSDYCFGQSKDDQKYFE